MSHSSTNSPSHSLLFLFFSAFVAPSLAFALFFFWVDPFDPAPFPTHELNLHNAPPLIVPKVNGRILRKSELVGPGRVLGPEDLVYEPGSRIVYTGCADGWVKRFKLSESGLGFDSVVVEDWVNTGGRPLGLAIARHGADVFLADAHKGLLKITQDKKILLLTNEAEGIRLKLTDGVDVTKDGTIYFTDASYKYGFEDYLEDMLESRPHGRLLSFNPNTAETKVLLRDLFFPNGLAISPDQNSLIFCETPLRRCRRYWLQGSRKGSVDAFIDNLPGYPDNIHFDGLSGYLIALSSWLSPFLERLRMCRLVRKSMVILNRYISLHFLHKYGGILSVDLEGSPVSHFYDSTMSFISSGIRIEDHLFIGSLRYPHIIVFNLSAHEKIVY